MRQCTKKDEQHVIHIITESFDSNPSVNWVIKNDRHRRQRIKALADYSFKTAMARNGAWISDDGEGVALCYRYNFKKEGFEDYVNQITLAFKAIGPGRIFKIMRRDSYFKSQRPTSGDYLYFWFLGVSDKGKGKTAAKELKDLIFSESARTGLPIYLETSVPKNRRVYERYGFACYHTWKDEAGGHEVWLMKREAVG